MTDWELKTDTRYGKFPFALSSVKVTVAGSVATAEPTSMTPFSPAFPAAASRSIVATTSSAVNGDPSCHVASVRSLNVHTLLSALGSHDTARPGPMSLVVGSSAARNSND